MCYNCGCGMVDDDMGKGKISKGGGSLTESDFKHMAEKWGMGVGDAKKHVFETLKKQIEK